MDMHAQGGPDTGMLTRWMWIWITVGILVVVIVIGFLLGINRALGSIDDGLLEASTSVSAIGQDANPLPDSVQSINTSLSATDTSLKQVPTQATQIADGLDKIRDSLKLVDGSLKDTAGSLTNTGGALKTTSTVLVGVAGATGDIDKGLVDTANILKDVRGRAGDIHEALKDAQNKDSKGTEAIPIRVNRANDVLKDVRSDTRATVGALTGVEKNLLSACNSPLLRLLAPMMCGS